MTRDELIEKLSEMPRNDEVCFRGDDPSWIDNTPVKTVTRDKYMGSFGEVGHEEFPCILLS